MHSLNILPSMPNSLFILLRILASFALYLLVDLMVKACTQVVLTVSLPFLSSVVCS